MSSLIRQHKRDYYARVFKECSVNTSKLWKVFNEITGHKNVNLSVNSLVINDVIINDDTQIVNNFNQYFISIPLTLKNTLPNVDYVITDKFLQFISLKEIKNNGFTIPLITKSQVTRWLHTLDKHKATGCDNLSATYLHSVGPVIVNTLQDIVNTSITSGIFPSAWKEAVVRPLHKGGVKNAVNNYRPISILCVASKLLERHVHSSLYDYVNTNNILCTSQSGFRQNHSCHSCLTNMLESWYSSINIGKVVCSVELDFSKAFDVLDHGILLSKLKFYGCDDLSLRWFESYLSQRTQYVRIDNTKSHTMSLQCGVPQGSILGPLLFILYTNDMHLYITHSRMDAYADDTNISKAGMSLDEIELGLQKDLDSINNWCNANKLIVNAKKCSVMVVCSYQKLSNINSNQVYLSINNQILNVVKCQKILGINIDSTLSWRMHIESVCVTVSKLLGLMWRVRHILDKRGMLMFYNSLILSRFNYCFSIWGDGPKDAMLKLFRLQKRAARLVLGCNSDVSTRILFDTLGWLTVHDLLFYQKCIFMFKERREICTGYLVELFDNVTSSKYNLRNDNVNNFKVPHPKLEMYKRSIAYCCVEQSAK